MICCLLKASTPNWNLLELFTFYLHLMEPAKICIGRKVSSKKKCLFFFFECAIRKSFKTANCSRLFWQANDICTFHTQRSEISNTYISMDGNYLKNLCVIGNLKRKKLREVFCAFLNAYGNQFVIRVFSEAISLFRYMGFSFERKTLGIVN